MHIKNVASTYSLEHESFDELFNSVFHCLDVLLEEEKNISKPFQELICCIGTIQTSIFQHMLKEEQQVGIYFIIDNTPPQVYFFFLYYFSSRAILCIIWLVKSIVTQFQSMLVHSLIIWKKNSNLITIKLVKTFKLLFSG